MTSNFHFKWSIRINKQGEEGVEPCITVDEHLTIYAMGNCKTTVSHRIYSAGLSLSVNI